MNLKKIAFFIFCLILIIGSILYIQNSKAAFEGEGLTISPPILELTLKPGEKSNQTIRLTNPTKNIVEIYPRMMNFTAGGENGEPSFYESTDESHKFSLASWIKYTQAKIALTPEQVVEFKYTVEVPTDAEPGGHYGVVFFANEPKKTESNSSKVTLGSMVGSLVLVKVPGQIVEKGIIDEFKTDKGFYLWGDVNLITRIENIGNVHFKPKGNIEIRGMFGDAEKLTFNEQSGNVLPSSIRKFENKWQVRGIKIGRYVAKTNLIYGEAEKSLVAEAVFWYIPWWILVILAVIITIVISLIVWRKRKKTERRSKKSKDKDSDNNTPEDRPSRIVLR